MHTVSEIIQQWSKVNKLPNADKRNALKSAGSTAGERKTYKITTSDCAASSRGVLGTQQLSLK